MFVIISRKYFNAMLAMVGIISLSLITVAVHPHFEEWKQEGIVVTDVKTNVKAVALTFDDGPQPGVTNRLLDILDKHDAHATFFVLGVQAKKYPQIVKRIAADGHDIGNHGYSHQFARYKNLDYAVNDIQKAKQTIQQITGKDSRMFRPPGGFLSDKMVDYCRKQKILIIAWTWNQDTRDWTTINGRQIAAQLLQDLEPGQIIILHDGGGHRNEMLKGVEIFLTSLDERGYRAVTVTELLNQAK